MQIQALDIRIGDRIFAYCNNKRQVCTVKQILDLDPNNVTLTVFTSELHRSSASKIVRFHGDALVDLASRKSVS